MEIFVERDKNQEVRGTKCFKTHLQASLIPKFSRMRYPGPPLKGKKGQKGEKNNRERRGEVAIRMSGVDAPAAKTRPEFPLCVHR